MSWVAYTSLELLTNMYLLTLKATGCSIMFMSKVGGLQHDDGSSHTQQGLNIHFWQDWNSLEIAEMQLIQLFLDGGRLW